MKKAQFILAAASLVACHPVAAQDGAEATEATEAAANATADAAAEAAEEAVNPSSYGHYVTPKDYDMVRPNPADYPVEAWNADEEGHVAYKVAVDADGKPTACEVTESSGFSSLDDKTCAVLMERAEFHPARDDQGNAIAGEYESSYYWSKREPEFPGSMKVHVAFDVDATGVTSNCEVIEISGEISDSMRKSFDREPCPGLGKRSQPPFRDAEGNPVARRIELILETRVSEPGQ